MKFGLDVALTFSKNFKTTLHFFYFSSRVSAIYAVDAAIETAFG